MLVIFSYFTLILLIRATASLAKFHLFENVKNGELYDRDSHDVARLGSHNRRGVFPNREEETYFDDIREESTDAPSSTSFPEARNDKTFNDLKNILQVLLKKLDALDIETNKNRKEAVLTSATEIVTTKEHKSKRSGNEAARTRWGSWTEWSSCSVSCGKGREIRWRHCLEQCDESETEMEEKTCQLPACGPGTIFGIKL